jgi:hypothetical protein
MQDIITLAPLVVEESHLNWLAPQTNIQDVQAAELKIRLWKAQTKSRQTQAKQPIQCIIFVSSLMKCIITLAPLVVKESYLNWLAAQPNITDLQASDLQSGCGKCKLGQGKHKMSNQFNTSYL